jgi:hypothetical protein
VAGALMVAAALIVALLAAHLVHNALWSSAVPAAGVASLSGDECRSGVDPGDPGWWPSCP